MTTTVDTSALDAVLNDLQSVVLNCDYQPMLEAFQAVIAHGEAEAFVAQSTPGGEPWEKLSEVTIRRKGHDVILIETSALMVSLVDINGPGNINMTMSHGLIFGTDVEYAMFHETGTSKMPARPVVGMSDETLDDLCERVAQTTIDSI